jgi:hypothetical protein
MEAFVFLQTVDNGRQLVLGVNISSTYPRRYVEDVFFACGLAGCPL